MEAIGLELKEMYDNYYSDKTELWRKIGAKKKVQNILDVAEGLSFTTVIEVGAGDGNILDELSKNKEGGEYTAIEISSSAIELLKKKNIPGLKEVLRFDGYHIPYPDKSFDLAICSHVIEHVEFPRSLLREIKRVSKKQAFEVPIDFSLNLERKFEHFNSYGHINIYTPSTFKYLLFTEGFSFIKEKYAFYSPEVIKFQKGLISLDFLLFAIKRTLFTIIPFLKKVKPNTYTVLTE